MGSVGLLTHDSVAEVAKYRRAQVFDVLRYVARVEQDAVPFDFAARWARPLLLFELLERSFIFRSKQDVAALNI